MIRGDRQFTEGWDGWGRFRRVLYQGILQRVCCYRGFGDAAGRVRRRSRGGTGSNTTRAKCGRQRVIALHRVFKEELAFLRDDEGV